VIRCQFDHLVVAAATLEAGADYIEGKLGIRVPEGGRHPLMGTHNRLMQLGGGAFLEIIAIDPEAPAPDRPRWFSLDDPATQERIAARPALATWVVRTRNIHETLAPCPIDAGPVETGRRGDMTWKITIREDGSMPAGGLFPTLIEWPDGAGPASRMSDLGCRLEALHIAHEEPQRLSAALRAIGASDLAVVERYAAGKEQGLRALIEGPRGLVQIS
jgi:hypothetical protein